MHVALYVYVTILHTSTYMHKFKHPCTWGLSYHLTHISWPFGVCYYYWSVFLLSHLDHWYSSIAVGCRCSSRLRGSLTDWSIAGDAAVDKSGLDSRRFGRLAVETPSALVVSLIPRALWPISQVLLTSFPSVLLTRRRHLRHLVLPWCQSQTWLRRSVLLWCGTYM